MWYRMGVKQENSLVPPSDVDADDRSMKEQERAYDANEQF